METLINNTYPMGFFGEVFRNTLEGCRKSPSNRVSHILKGDLLFDSGKAELRLEAKQSL